MLCCGASKTGSQQLQEWQCELALQLACHTYAGVLGVVEVLGGSAAAASRPATHWAEFAVVQLSHVRPQLQAGPHLRMLASAAASERPPGHSQGNLAMLLDLVLVSSRGPWKQRDCIGLLYTHATHAVGVWRLTGQLQPTEPVMPACLGVAGSVHRCCWQRRFVCQARWGHALYADDPSQITM
jgi:hypothetical protein